ncbi:class I SAM-dependent methyltransferase [Sphingomonas sp. Leaf10]|uniref:class I SAM-dependent methyltransferase n=1 Tax=Sphingomonas sp. Leaf10 TaxID=1735676 RepID=UPI00070220CC|nr:class I SAM-dependent methyltransferase [Sphingomonas sp. Leaf10]KQM35879.1 hypothetical protein ASE59_17795 [Sphingomonas sp. Leaf10]
MKTLAILRDQLRVMLSRAGLRPGEYSGDYDRLSRLYRRPDPWRLDNDGDRVRFERTNALIARIAPGADSLLEIGAGEGMQTEYLARLGARITTIEVSADAVARARERVPDARILHGRAEGVATLVAGQRFDVAVACEVLYYLPDPAVLIAALQRIADRVVVTNYARLDHRIAPLLASDGWQCCDDIRHGRAAWHCHVWTAPPTDRSAACTGPARSICKEASR